VIQTIHAKAKKVSYSRRASLKKVMGETKKNLNILLGKLLWIFQSAALDDHALLPFFKVQQSLARTNPLAKIDTI
jgi:hypothetical protein